MSSRLKVVFMLKVNIRLLQTILILCLKLGEFIFIECKSHSPVFSTHTQSKVQVNKLFARRKRKDRRNAVGAKFQEGAPAEQLEEEEGEEDPDEGNGGWLPHCAGS